MEMPKIESIGPNLIQVLTSKCCHIANLNIANHCPSVHLIKSDLTFQYQQNVTKAKHTHEI